MRAFRSLPLLALLPPALLAAASPAPVFVHRAISEAVGHTLVADIDGDGHNDVALHLHRDDYHLKKLTDRTLGLAWLRWPDFQRIDIFRGDVTGDRFAAADVNRDGRIDLVSCRIRSDGRQLAAWYENPGTRPAGGPAPMWREHVAGDIPEGQIKDVLAGDLDRDGRIDLAVRMLTTTELFLQRAGGWHHRTLTHPSREGLALADLDLDGDLDLVLNGFWFETPADVEKGEFIRRDLDAKWFNQTGGGWPDNATYVQVGDLNRDGLPDVVLCHSEKVGYPLSWYSVDSLAQVKTGPWREHVIAPTFEWCETLGLGDVDHDGTLDVFAAKFPRHDPPGGRWYNAPPYPVSIFYNTAGDGSQWRRQDLAMDGAYAAMLGDVGSDGDLDIVGPRSYWTGPIRLWENQLSNRPLALDRWTYVQVDADRAKYGDFPAAGVKKNIRYFGLALADLTGDGRKDIVSGRYFYRNPGGDMSAKWERVDFGLNVDACLTLDVDGDAFGDVIALALPGVYWLEASDRTGSAWTARQIGTAPLTKHCNSQGFATGQIVPGGRPEIVVATEDGIYYFEVPAQPGSGDWPRTLITKEASDEGLDLADVDRDGWIDLIAANGEKDLAWWKNPGAAGGAWKRFVVGQTAPHPVDRVRVRDLNGDGRPDIAVTEERYPGKEPDANLWWFEAPADPTSPDWKRHRVTTTWSLNNLDAADFDRDGDIDLVTCEHKGPDLRLLLYANDGRGHFTEHVLDRGKESHLGTLTADLDGDGDLEIVSIGWDQHKFLHLWRNDALPASPSALRLSP